MNMQESLGTRKIRPVVVFSLESLPYSHFYPPALWKCVSKQRGKKTPLFHLMRNLQFFLRNLDWKYKCSDSAFCLIKWNSSFCGQWESTPFLAEKLDKGQNIWLPTCYLLFFIPGCMRPLITKQGQRSKHRAKNCTLSQWVCNQNMRNTVRWEVSLCHDVRTVVTASGWGGIPFKMLNWDP